MVDATTIPQPIATGVADALRPVVINCQALVIEAKQAHWHVRGANFIGIHKLLDKLVDNALEYADLAAERIIALGYPVNANLTEVQAGSTLPPITPGFVDSATLIPEVLAQIDAALETVRAAVETLDEIDQVSQDVVIEIARGLDKDRWFLFAHTV
jgi:starvation-inducible DNA-binding protein